jgi:hypothetical protein
MTTFSHALHRGRSSAVASKQLTTAACDRADWREAYALFSGDVAYVWHGALRGEVIATNLASCGLQPRAQIIWAKQHFTLGRGDYHWQHETCCYAVREGKTSHWQGDRRQTTVWEIPNNNPFGNPQHEQSWGHGTQKPVECDSENYGHYEDQKEIDL